MCGTRGPDWAWTCGREARRCAMSNAASPLYVSVHSLLLLQPMISKPQHFGLSYMTRRTVTATHPCVPSPA
jgi:hypothetical protein